MTSENHWKEIWSKREFQGKVDDSFEETFCKLKTMDGYDLNEDAISLSDYLLQIERLFHSLEGWEKYQISHTIRSIFEVGCGSGPTLLGLSKFIGGGQIGGVDYSPSMIDAARQILKEADLVCGDAKEIDVDKPYDAVISNGVFMYFQDISYAAEVLKRMIKKADKVVGLVEVYDEEKREDFYRLRRELDPDYDQKYKGLPKLFYPRSFFTDIAKEQNCIVRFEETKLGSYWNNPFIYDVYLYKR